MTAALGRRPKLLRVATNNFLSVGVEIDRDEISDYMQDSLEVKVSKLGSNGMIVVAGTLACYNVLEKII